nr:MAG TPA: hypothetical protein [Bacteriophage sp.]
MLIIGPISLCTNINWIREYVNPVLQGKITQKVG